MMTWLKTTATLQKKLIGVSPLWQIHQLLCWQNRSHFFWLGQELKHRTSMCMGAQLVLFFELFFRLYNLRTWTEVLEKWGLTLMYSKLTARGGLLDRLGSGVSASHIQGRILKILWLLLDLSMASHYHWPSSPSGAHDQSGHVRGNFVVMVFSSCRTGPGR